MQKFKRGDKVHITKDMPSYMSHFKCNYDGIVEYSYKDKYGGNTEREEQQYSIMDCATGGSASWYDEDQLTFISHVGEDGIRQVELNRDRVKEEESNLEWIVKHWREMKSKNSISGYSISSLAKQIGISDLWGSRGEGITLYMNTLRIFSIFDTVLSTGDLEHARQFIEEFNTEIRNKMSASAQSH